jgi:STE24 endopeptidase
MIEINGYFVVILVALVAVYLLDLLSNLLNLQALSAEVPEAFRDTVDAEAYARSQAYTRAHTYYDLAASTFSLAVLLTFWWLGGFAWLDGWVRSWTDSPIIQGLAFVGLLSFGSYLLNLPFTLYNTFVIEERFGFNRTSLATFVSDQIKEWTLAILLGGPLLAGLLWVFERWGADAWLPAWLLFTVVSLTLAYLAPSLILPWFHRFETLPDGELKQAIHQLAERCHFPLREVYQIDGSRRSTKTNAFFTGFGRNKRIALYDTLIRNHSVPGLVAVLAHEIGHYRKHHIVQRIVISVVETGILFYLLGFFLKNESLFRAFGVEQISVYGSLVFFSLLLTPLRRLLELWQLMLSRRHEFEADEYAARATGHAVDLQQSLRKLALENLSNLTPHPFFVFWNYSHPPLTARLHALERLE